LYILYQIGRYYPDIAVVHSADGGSTFGERVFPGDSSFQNYHQHGSDIALDDSGHLYVAFTDKRYGKYNLFVTSATVQPTEVKEDEQAQLLPENFRLSQNYPNPFNSSTVIKYQLSGPCVVQLGVFNVQGQLIRFLEHGRKSAGSYQARWDGTDAGGREVASGIYFCVLRVSGQRMSKKLLLLR
jgi:hypothetical protein